MTSTTYAHPAQQFKPTMLHEYTRPKSGASHSTSDQQNMAIAPAVLTIREACAALKVSKWTLYRLIHTRQLRTIKIGSRRVVPVESVRLLIDRLSEDDA